MKTCTACEVEKAPQDFYKRGDSDKLRSHCRACCDGRTMADYEKDKAAYRLRSRKHYLMKLYGLTMDAYHEMLRVRDNRCDICGEREQQRRTLAVDHCHISGRIRGLLCMACNTALGKFRDSPELILKAHAYVLSHA